MTDSTITSPGYRDFVESLKTRVRAARVRAGLSVNRELVLLYWDIGRDILARQAEVGWGAKVIDQISRDLRGAFPDMKGFSPRNLKDMRAFAEAWPGRAIVQAVLAQVTWYLTRLLPDSLQSTLPTVEALEAELADLPAPEGDGEEPSEQ